MKLSLEGIKEKEVWAEAGISLPPYNVEETRKKAMDAPQWVHFGIGNIFRVFIGGIADGLLRDGLMDRGITCVECYDYEIVDRIYRPFDNLGFSVILNSDGSRKLRVLGSMAEAVKADPDDPCEWARMKEIFRSPSLQLVSFTITEKGYALTDPEGAFFPYIQSDLEAGPEKARTAMPVVASMLLERFRAGGTPLALVSMDNCAKNGRLLKRSVITVAEEWLKRDAVQEDFLAWLENEDNVSFLSTMIDKITPRPGEMIAKDLAALGLSDMQPVETAKRTYIAPFVNAEKPQYLVIEDRFPNGRPALEHGFGVYLGDFETVNLSERMKVTACLNPVHSATGPLGVVLGIEGFAEMLRTVPEVLKMARTVAYQEGMPVIRDPGILSPQAFTDELFDDRFPNEYLGDTNLRLSTDVSQGVSVRFGETIKAYVQRDGSAEKLLAIPLGIAGWLRYMMAFDDQGKTYTLAPDPMNETFTEAYRDVIFGKPETLTDQLRPILSNASVFGIDLYQAGLGEKITGMVREMLEGPGSALRTVRKYFG